MPYGEILFEKDGPIAILTLNRPDIRNAITDQAIVDEIVDACQRVQTSADIRVLILTGAGSAFSAGGNIKDMQGKMGMFAGDPGQIRENYRMGIQRIPLTIHHLDVPTIAAVNGPAIGAGCDLTCMCDIRIASEKARFGETFAALGLIPGDGGTFFLPRVIGFSKTCELVFTCRTIDAAEALRIGLVSEVTAPETLINRCVELAREIARQPARTLRMAKRLLTLSRGKTLEEVLELSAAFQAVCHHTPEHALALDAFLARQKPA
jgi:enoyl-CoA hydratase/carnithine racemase